MQCIRSFQCWSFRAISLAVLPLASFLLVQPILCSALADEIPTAEALVKAFHDAQGKTPFPYRLSAKLTLTPDKNVSISGQIAYAREDNRSRIEITAGDYHEIRVTAGDQEYVSSSNAALPRRALLEGLEAVWSPNFTRTCCNSFSKVEKKKIDGVKAYCFTTDLQDPRPRHICLDREKKWLLETYNGFERVRFFDYRIVEGFRYPGRIVMVDDGNPVVEIRDLEIQKGAPAESFTPPGDSRKFDHCAGGTYEHPIQLPLPRMLIYSWYATVYGLIQTDGSLTNVQIEVSRGDDDFRRSLREAVAQWKWAPATCGGKPVITELQFEIHN